ncbi:MAG TPA: hypothetical protein VGS19_37125 [Streptosporangiaceae bacterium]|nr:hypothetical protein [Streptosporangiaceae bacterium]
MQGWSRRKTTGWLGARLAMGAALTAFVAVALAGSTLAAPAGAASVARALWQIQDSPNATAPSGQLESVSCSSADACTAVGANTSTRGLTVTLAERWNGTSWQPQHTPQPEPVVPGSVPGLFGVSCPTPAFCEAVGTSQVGGTGISLAYGWNGSAWKQQSFPVPLGSTAANLEQVSCTSASFCEAVGSYQDGTSGTFVALAAQWDGSSWRLQRTPAQTGSFRVILRGVSCVSAQFCEAVGDAQGVGAFAQRWNGTSWHLQGPAAASAVSCVSTVFCEGVGFGGGALWDGSSWTAQTIPAPADSTFVSLNGVSCVTKAFCEAVGQYFDNSGNAFSLGVTWNGTSWALQTTPNPPAATSTGLNQVSCAAVTSCETAGDSQLTNSSGQVPLVESWNGSSWQIQHAVLPRGAVTNNLSAVSCLSAVFCEAVGSHFDSSSAATVALAEVWDGSTWALQKTPDPAQAVNGVRMVLNGVSCASATFCEAVGSSSATAGGGAEVWNGSIWAVQAVPGGSLTSVSCASASFCMAAGADGHADIWDGTSWSAQPTASGFTALSGVSCLSPSFCEAAGSGPAGDGAEAWNGTTWSPQAVPAPSDGNGPVLSAVSCTGAQSCEAVGSYTSSTTFEAVPLAEVWNGTAWAVQPVPSPAAASTSSLAGVWCTSADSCTAVGGYIPNIGPSATVAEVWGGSVWRLQATPDHPYAGQNSLNGVSCGASNTCTAVGGTTNPGQTPATLVETGD